MRPRPVLASLVVLAAISGTAFRPAAAAPVEFVSNVGAQRSVSVFAGVLPAFTQTNAMLNVSHQFGTMTDANGTSHADEQTNVLATPTSLDVTGDAVADLTVSAALLPPAASTFSMNVHFTTIVPTDYSLKGAVSASNLALPSDDSASVVLTGPGNFSVGFGKSAPAGPWTFTGDFAGVLPPGEYQLAVSLRTTAVNPTVQQLTRVTNLQFHVGTFAPPTPGKYVGLCRASSGTTPSDATDGLAVATVKPKSKFAVKLQLGGKTSSASGVVDVGGRLLDKKGAPLVVKRKGRPDLTFTLVADGTRHKVTGAAVETGTGASSDFDLDLAVYTSKKNPKPPFRNPAAALVRSYTVFFALAAPGDQTLTPSITTDKYPQGAGWATLVVDKSGNAKLKGKLADGSAVACTCPLSKDDRFAFYVPLYAKTGSLSCVATFGPVEATDLYGGSLRWFKPGGARAPVYPAGWPAGVVGELIGVKYAAPTAGGGGAINGIPTTAGAATVRLSGAGLANAPIAAPATIDAKSKVSIVGDNSVRKLTVTINAKTGAVTGSFVHPTTGKKTTFSGVVVQFAFGGSASGFFLDGAQSGSFGVD